MKSDAEGVLRTVMSPRGQVKKIFIWESNHPDFSFSDYLWIPDRC